jgi:hypothetical protein
MRSDADPLGPFLFETEVETDPPHIPVDEEIVLPSRSSDHDYVNFPHREVPVGDTVCRIRMNLLFLRMVNWYR